MHRLLSRFNKPRTFFSTLKTTIKIPLKTRVKTALIGNRQNIKLDDVLAISSWFLSGTTLFIVLATTTATSLILLFANAIDVDNKLATFIANNLTKFSGLDVSFESAVVPVWKDGVLRFKNVNITCNDKTWSEWVIADSKHKGIPISPQDIDLQFTYYSLSVENIDVQLSFMRWIKGQGVIKECSVSGVRGNIDRTHLIFDNWVPQRRFPKHGDFDIEKFVVRDLMVQVNQPNFRPFSISIFNAELPQLRKQWILYDFLKADSVVGMVEGCLFSVYKPQRTDFPVFTDNAHLKISGLPIDHVNYGSTGPFSWLYAGKMDVDLHLIIPYTTETLITQVTDEINEIKENALEKFEQAIHSNNNFSKLETIYFKLKNNITYTHQNKQPRASYEVQYQMDSCDDLKISGKSVILYWDIKMHDLKANIPFSTPELSYLSNTMIRPIVSYLNSNKNVTNVSFSTEVDLGNFNGSWGLYESGIVDILSIEIGKGINHIVGHDLSSFEAWRNMSFWGVQYLSRQILAVLGGVKGLTRYSYTGPDGSMWYYQHEYLN